jgi:hypothetical protein
MKPFPDSKLAWARFALFPFKAYVAVAFPLACLIPNPQGRHGWNESLITVLPGYGVCFLILLAGGLVERSYGHSREGNTSLAFAAASLFVFFGPWFRL